MLSDEALIDRMNTRSAANGYKIDSLVETIVTSPQFLNKRGPDPRQQSTSKETPQSMAKPVKKGE